MSKEQNPIDLLIADHICERRQEKGLSQQELADALNIPLQDMQAYESASCRVRADRLYAISKILDVSLKYFFTGMNKTPGIIDNDGQGANIPALSPEEEAWLEQALEKIDNGTDRERMIELMKKVKSHLQK